MNISDNPTPTHAAPSGMRLSYSQSGMAHELMPVFENFFLSTSDDESCCSELLLLRCQK